MALTSKFELDEDIKKNGNCNFKLLINRLKIVRFEKLRYL